MHTHTVYTHAKIFSIDFIRMNGTRDAFDGDDDGDDPPAMATATQLSEPVDVAVV